MGSPNQVQEDETALIARIRDGDVEAYSGLVKRFQGPLMGFIFNLVHDRQLAQDLAQETFLKAYKSLRSYENRNNAAFSTWLFSIARNACIDALRRTKWKYEEIQEGHAVTSGEPGPLEGLDGARFRQVVESGLAQLHEKYRVAFELTLVQGFTYEEAARIMDSNLGTVRSRVHKAREHLKGKLRKVFITE